MKTITIGRKVITLEPLTGTVLSASKNLETKVSGSGGGNSGSVSITSKTIVHDQLFLLDQHGAEHSYQLRNFNLACREGNTLSVITAVKKDQSNGHYVAAINHTTGKTYFGSEGLFRAGMPNLLILSAIYIGIFIVGCITSGSDFILPALLIFFAFMGYFLCVMWINARGIKKAIIQTDFKTPSFSEVKA